MAREACLILESQCLDGPPCHRRGFQQRLGSQDLHCHRYLHNLILHRVGTSRACQF
jgi:hypothetical protein